MNIASPVASHLAGVDFSFLAPDEIHKLSVKEIRNPETFDTLKHPCPGGLHDPSLGTFLDNACTTCKLNKFTCPGHCGHIDLPELVYHPLFFDQILRLLRAQCDYCHRAKLSRIRATEAICKLQLLKHGLVNAVAGMDDAIAKPSTGPSTHNPNGDSDSDDEDDDTKIGKIRAYTKEQIKRFQRKNGSTADLEKSEMVREARFSVLSEVLKDMSTRRKCPNCNCTSPSYRKDRFVRIYRNTLAETYEKVLRERGITYENPLITLRTQIAKSEKRQSRGVVDEAVADLDPMSADEDGDVQMEDDDIGGGLVLENAQVGMRQATKVEEKRERYMSAQEIHAALTLLFQRETELFNLIYRPATASTKTPITPDMFFIKTMLVPPSKYRPDSKNDRGDVMEHMKNNHYKGILQCGQTVRQISSEILNPATSESGRKRSLVDYNEACVRLQEAVNSLIDKDRNPNQGLAARRNLDGIKQDLEKKEGLFRMNMMGKRVNYAARSVISPDPNIETNEIGVPPVFATRLTYPEPVTNHNYFELKEAVLNGPDKWPGAVAIENENGQMINLRHKNVEERQALANQLLAPSSTSDNGSRGKKVYRHLNNGDVVLMNRQPTLHKPSMMAHRARVLPGEKTIRMHYANCNTYNADFDGDEMNMHLPQNEIGRAEAILIAATDEQYLSGTAGKPLRGLIQDHISMGVRLTNKDTFFTRGEYFQLMYAALRPEDNHTTHNRLITLPPAIFRPRKLWTGKQIISTVLENIRPIGTDGLTLTAGSQTPKNLWGTDSEEGDVIFQNGVLITGILDKNHIGPSGGGFINGIYEVYGSRVAGRLLSILGRLLTKMLHMQGFSCGVEDLILTHNADTSRGETVDISSNVGFEAAAKYVNLDPEEARQRPSELSARLEKVLRNPAEHSGLDTVMRSAGSEVTTKLQSACVPAGVVKPFPKNQMLAMTATGAKGSNVNANQISTNLGQQVLEGRRVPVMVSGKTLPCFTPYDPSLRAGGYITDRFLTGVRPQEYYFHAMAGREGLIDTAVKTSRSGYLQRCLVKGMEGLRVEYDGSVRDSDGAMIQFLYGEDGLDVARQKYLFDFKFLTENFADVYRSLNAGAEHERMYSEEAKSYNKKALKKARNPEKAWKMDPATAVYPPTMNAGSTSEKFLSRQRDFIDEDEHKLLVNKKKGQTKRRDGSGARLVTRKPLEAMLDIKYLKSLVEPGEAVGIVAGQSVGEPSTQMTLNTFHLAGHAAKNVTLGIPRLREVLMTASRSISTPAMTLHLTEDIPNETAQTFAKSISRLALSEVVESCSVKESVGKGVSYTHSKYYTVRLDFFPAEEYMEEFAIQIEDIIRAIQKNFLPDLISRKRKELKRKVQESRSSHGSRNAIGVGKKIVERPPGPVEDVADGEEEGDGDADDAKRAGRTTNFGYDDAEEEEENVISAQEKSTEVMHEEEDETYGGSPKESEAEDEDATDLASKVEKARANVSRVREETLRERKETREVSSFKFDDEHGQWCEFSIEQTMEDPKVLLLPLVEAALKMAVIHDVPGIIAGDVNYEDQTDEATGDKSKVAKSISTRGANLLAMRDSFFQNVIDPHRIFTNDVAAMLEHYGVEAARATIVRELDGVFGGHGISVDNRHLNLIADYMTRGGSFKAFNRMGMTHGSSPFMKMSFETTVKFLTQAVLGEDTDILQNPSSRIVAGKLSRVGTGAFDVMMPLPLDGNH
ncbi:DNA-directed RNA polymerase [Eremomyces bilateralis CBS 781.70]|uniref:DNA-directed RNA polymerase subunit n=1 Tax=Eremomyces bilateralis CBS 781.70 TaxID=1392243 RepID=A0A6G1FT46_9PEZI|nr:DNA-directed RNA polymerase [Eremomyces bilateralis CBS 781.70]KAF1809045.1 DNA-directed RNA polymerase [Eremomyces bilateralis CBS 781.70]